VDVGILITADITEGAMDAMGLHPGTTVWAAVKTTAIRVYR
jgi:molybdopterin-binding protein